ncbi:hypothetical protein V6N13_020072 [Hibiscus sabdariffa]|uniref:Uncharacterized protein n=1 Tax=Hibiscus sabdariffa TaxID=183260 RepID=A0ABR2ESF7_9ROSI
MCRFSAWKEAMEDEHAGCVSTSGRSASRGWLGRSRLAVLHRQMQLKEGLNPAAHDFFFSHRHFISSQAYSLLDFEGLA